jgi:hypothetical protein
MSVCFSLNGELSCDKICSQIQKMINSYQQNNQINENSLLVIEIKQIIDSKDNLMPKLTYEPAE